MQKSEFVELVKSTTFDESMKQLLLTSYSIGYDQGKVETLKEAIERIDWFSLERKCA